MWPCLPAVVQDGAFHDGGPEAEELVVEVLGGGLVAAILGGGVVVVEEGFEGPGLVGEGIFEGGGEGVGEFVGGREGEGEAGGEFVSVLSTFRR